MFDDVGLFRALGSIFQIVLIVDANIIIRDILWLTTKRKNLAARSEFFELLTAQTVVGIAPTFLLHEMKVNLPELSRKRGIPLALLEEHWVSYMHLLTFVDAGGPDPDYEDPKDAPYLKLQEQSNHLILSKDSDIARMGGRVASATLVSRLCIYSRYAAVEYTLKAGGSGSIILSFGLVKGIIAFCRTIVAHTAKLPRWVVVVILLGVLCASLHRPTREMFLRLLQSLPLRAQSIGSIVLKHLSKLASEHTGAKSIANDALATIRSEIALELVGDPKNGATRGLQ